MRVWLQSLKNALENGYLFITSTDASSLLFIINLLNDIDNYKSIKLSPSVYQHIRSTFDNVSTDNLVNRYLKNKIATIYNKLAKEAGEKHLRVDNDNEANIEDLITHQISLAVSYHRLANHYAVEHHIHNATHERIEATKAIANIERTIQQNLTAFNGLILLKQQTIKLNSGINLRKGIQLTWDAITSLTEKQKDLKKQFTAQLTDIFLSQKDFKQERNPVEIEKILHQLLYLVNNKTSQVKIIDNFSDINQLIKERCHYHLKEYIAKEHISEQRKILLHLDNNESVCDHLFFAKYVSDVTTDLEKEFSVYELACHIKNSKLEKKDRISINALIKTAVTASLNEISAPWLRENIKTQLRASLDSWKEIRSMSTKNTVLLEVLDYEIKCSRDESRAALLKTLRSGLFTKELVPTWRSDEEQIDTIYKSYKNILAIDQLHNELKEIEAKYGNPLNKFLPHGIAASIKEITEKYQYEKINNAVSPMFYYHKEIKARCLYWYQFHPYLETTIREFKKDVTEKIITEEKKISQRVNERIKKENDLFKQDYLYPESYEKISDANQELLDKIAAIFKDYADKAHWYYFHAFRSHAAEAREIERVIREKKDISQVKQHMIAINNVLLTKETYNIEGSFSRRLQFCFQMLDVNTVQNVRREKQKDIFTTRFNYPASYKNLSHNHDQVFDKISTIFKDYADKAHWYYFHAFRSHAAEAREIQSIIREIRPAITQASKKKTEKDLEIILECIQNLRHRMAEINNRLLKKSTYNLEGSFSRRLNYSFILLNEAESTMEAALTKTTKKTEATRDTTLIKRETTMDEKHSHRLAC